MTARLSLDVNQQTLNSDIKALRGKIKSGTVNPHWGRISTFFLTIDLSSISGFVFQLILLQTARFKSVEDMATRFNSMTYILQKSI